MISAPQPNRYQYSGNGSTTTFAFNSIFQNPGDLVVIQVVAGVATTLVLGTHYTVTGGGGATGSVVFVVAPAVGTTIVIVAVPPIQQSVNFAGGGAFPAATANTALDYLTELVQRNNDLATRSLVLADSDTSTISALPAQSSRANSYLAFDVNGNPIATSTAPIGSLIFSTLGAQLAQAVSAAAALTFLGFSAFVQTLVGAADAASFRNLLGFVAGILPATLGGTGLSVFAVGDLLYAATTTTFARLAAGASGTMLQIVGGLPTWQSVYLRNWLLNSDFNLCQRFGDLGNTTVANGVSTYVVDRWYIKNSLGTSGIITGTHIVGTVGAIDRAFKVQITTAPNAAQANGCELYQTLETRDAIYFVGQNASFGVNVKALGNVTQIGLQFFSKTSEAKVDTAIGSETLVTVNTSTFTLAQLLNQALGSGWSSGVVGVRIRPTAVSSGNLYDLNNGFIVSQAQVNLGPVLGAWQRAYPTLAAEIAACQRFYEKSYELGVPVGNNTAVGQWLAVTAAVIANGGTVFTIPYKVPKRALGTVTTYTQAGTSGQWSFGVSTVTNNSTSSFPLTNNTGGTLADATTVFGHWTVDAEI